MCQAFLECIFVVLKEEKEQKSGTYFFCKFNFSISIANKCKYENEKKKFFFKHRFVVIRL